MNISNINNFINVKNKHFEMLRPRSGSSNGRSRWRHEVFRRHVAQAKRIFYKPELYN